MNKKVLLLTGAGQIGMAIARRMGYGMKIVIGDKSLANATATAGIMVRAGFDAVPVETDISSRTSILALIAEARRFGEISMLVNAAGVSPSQAPIETILKVDLYGTAVLLEEVGKVIAPGGTGITISSQSGHRMPALTPEQDALLATTPTEQLLALDLLQPTRLRDTLHAYQMAKRCNVKRVMAEAVRWANGMPVSIPFRPASSSRRWPSTNSTARAEISTGRCSPTVRPDGPERRTRWPTWPNCS